jgi:hypothetical protein
VLAVKSTMTHSTDPTLLPPTASSLAEDGQDTVVNTGLAAKPTVLFSIPSLSTEGNELLTGPAVDQGAPTDHVARRIPPAIVPISVPEANVLQTLIHGTKQRFLDLASGSLTWRLFVGSGVALFVGAVALILLGPSPEQLQSEKTTQTISNLQVVDQQDVSRSDGVARNSAIQLTISTSENGDAAEPAEIDDPFTAANQVPPKVVQAVHLTDSSDDTQGPAIQTVSHSGTAARQPAWLSGTIEFENDEN